MGLGSLMFALPHFTTDLYLSEQILPVNNQSTKSEELCVPGKISVKNNAEIEAAETLIQNLQNYKYFFVFGQILHGIGAAPLVTLGTTFLDEIVPKTSSPLYIGIFQTFFVVGPALGYLFGGLFLNIYTDFDAGIQIEGLDKNSPLWVGACTPFPSLVDVVDLTGSAPRVAVPRSTMLTTVGELLKMIAAHFGVS